MILNSVGLTGFYNFLRLIQEVNRHDIDIKIDKNVILLSQGINSRDKKFNENDEEIKTLHYNNEITGYDFVKSKIREELSNKYKKNGLAKVGATSRFDFVVNETRKNSLLVLNSSDWSVLLYAFNSVNDSLSQELKEKNKEFLEYFNEIKHKDIFNRCKFCECTFLKVSSFDREIILDPDGLNKKYSFQYYYGKFKSSLYNNSADPTRMKEYLNLIDSYVNFKEVSKEKFFYINDRSTSLYDLIFMPGLQTIESLNNNEKLKIIV